MRWPVAIVLAAGLTTAIGGCRTPPRKDLVEAELRVKDQDLRELRSELERTDAYNQYLQRELRNLQQTFPGSAPSETMSAAVVRSVLLGRQTGGVDDDNCPGDEALQVVLEPRDCDNHNVKVPGTVQIQALEVTTEGVKKPISAWHVDPETLRKSWRSGLLSTGYYLHLPWKVYPSSSKVRVVVQFVTQDQRLFEADRDVMVRLTPAALRKTGPIEDGLPPVPAVGPMGMPSSPPSTLPAPAAPAVQTGPTLPAPKDTPMLPAPKESEPEKKKDELTPPSPPGPPLPPAPPAPPAPVEVPSPIPAAAADPTRPLKDVVQLLKPIVREE